MLGEIIFVKKDQIRYKNQGFSADLKIVKNASKKFKMKNYKKLKYITKKLEKT
jgi:hypothetical protein